MSLKERMREDNCDWLDAYLKSLIQLKDIKRYNRVKNLIYYFPHIIDGMSLTNFKTAMDNPDDTYLCLNSNDERYKVFDRLYENKNGQEFSPQSFYDSRYVTIGDISNYFGL